MEKKGRKKEMVGGGWGGEGGGVEEIDEREREKTRGAVQYIVMLGTK